MEVIGWVLFLFVVDYLLWGSDDFVIKEFDIVMKIFIENLDYILKVMLFIVECIGIL